MQIKYIAVTKAIRNAGLIVNWKIMQVKKLLTNRKWNTMKFRTMH